MSAGSKIRSLAKITLFLLLISTFFIAIVMASNARYDSAFGYFILILLCGGMVSVVEYFFLDAFGALVESNEEMRDTLNAIKGALPNQPDTADTPDA